MYDEGFVSESGASGTVNCSIVSLCLIAWDSGIISTWGPGVKIDFSNLGKTDHKFVPLDEAKQKQISKFFKNSRFSSHWKTCFDVPIDYWK